MSSFHSSALVLIGFKTSLPFSFFLYFIPYNGNKDNSPYKAKGNVQFIGSLVGFITNKTLEKMYIEIHSFQTY